MSYIWAKALISKPYGPNPNWSISFLVEIIGFTLSHWNIISLEFLWNLEGISI